MRPPKLMGMSTAAGRPEVLTPPANVYEGNGELTISTPISGAHGPHTEVVVAPDRVRVTATNKYPQESQHYHRREWQVGSWELDVELPKRVDPALARATLNLGMLVVMAPISESGGGEARPPVTEG
jgi:HSP20 family molecular chaperone IbpA